MKKLLAVLLMCMITVPSFAGIGIHVNYDMKKIDSDHRTFGFEGETYTATLGREESGNPVGGGIDFSFGMLPIVDLLFSLEGAFAKYRAGYWTDVPGFESVDEEIGYLRVGLDATVAVDILGVPSTASVLDIFVGAGPTLMLQAPIWSEDLIRDNISSATEPVSPTDFIDDIVTKFGLHLAAGVKVSPPAIPLYFRVMAKYYMLPGVDEPNLGRWMTISAGVGFGG